MYITITTVSDFNSLHQKLLFTMENDHDSQLNYLDLTIKRTPKQLSFEIYRKPTATDILIHRNSCHPIQQKISGINYLVKRLNTYSTSAPSKKKGNTHDRKDT
jgi:hypothetical protein